MAANEPLFCGRCCNMGHFLWYSRAVRVKRFVNVHLHYIVSNLIKISKMLTLSPFGKIAADAYARSQVLKFEGAKIQFRRARFSFLIYV